jgi:type II secretory ATPase GspE/PulE/Tfp pilus assembly ATPase PilB-like protein
VRPDRLQGPDRIYQLLSMSETLESLAAAKARREEIERAAIGEGMRTLWDDGLAKVAAGPHVDRRARPRHT